MPSEYVISSFSPILFSFVHNNWLVKERKSWKLCSLRSYSARASMVESSLPPNKLPIFHIIFWFIGSRSHALLYFTFGTVPSHTVGAIINILLRLLHKSKDWRKIKGKETVANEIGNRNIIHHFLPCHRPVTVVEAEVVISGPG